MLYYKVWVVEYFSQNFSFIKICRINNSILYFSIHAWVFNSEWSSLLVNRKQQFRYHPIHRCLSCVFICMFMFLIYDNDWMYVLIFFKALIPLWFNRKNFWNHIFLCIKFTLMPFVMNLHILYILCIYICTFVTNKGRYYLCWFVSWNIGVNYCFISCLWLAVEIIWIWLPIICLYVHIMNVCMMYYGIYVWKEC